MDLSKDPFLNLAIKMNQQDRHHAEKSYLRKTFPEIISTYSEEALTSLCKKLIMLRHKFNQTTSDEIMVLYDEIKEEIIRDKYEIDVEFRQDKAMDRIIATIKSFTKGGENLIENKFMPFEYYLSTGNSFRGAGGIWLLYGFTIPEAIIKGEHLYINAVDNIVNNAGYKHDEGDLLIQKYVILNVDKLRKYGRLLNKNNVICSYLLLSKAEEYFATHPPFPEVTREEMSEGKSKALLNFKMEKMLKLETVEAVKRELAKEHTTGGAGYKEKYLKYKNKYLELKKML